MTDSTALTRRREPEPAALQVASDAAALWKADWQSFNNKMTEHDFKKVAQVVLSSFPEMGALELTKYFDLLGGKLRENAEFWAHVTAGHPSLEWGPQLTPLEHGTPEWDQWLDKSIPEGMIAAAYVCAIKRRDREQPFEEANYVLRTDPILWEQVWQEFPQAESRAQALALAGEQLQPGDEIGKVGKWDNVWKVAVKTLREDWVILAKKKARSTAARRCSTRAFSLTEAKITLMLHQAQEVINRVATRGEIPVDLPDAVEVAPGVSVRAAGVKTTPIREPVHPYGLAPDPADDVAPVEEPAPEEAPDEEPAAPLKAESRPPGPEYLSEPDRRKMFAWAGERDFGDLDAHEGLKRVIAQVRVIPLAEVSTKQVTYADLPQIRAELEVFPFKPPSA